MEEAHYKKSIFHNGKIILKEMDREIELNKFLELDDMDTDALIFHENLLRSKKNNSKLLFAARDELDNRDMIWDSESEKWKTSHDNSFYP